MSKKTLLKQLQGMTLGVLLACSTAATAEEVAPQQIVVDDNKIECPSAQYSSIQEAVDAATPGTEIKVCAGSYQEQVTITKSVKLIGENGAVITPKGMKTNAENLAMYEDMAAVIAVRGVADVVIQGLTIDGKNGGISDCSTELAGIVCEDMSGKIERVNIRNMSNNSQMESCQSAYGIFVQSSDTAETDLKVNQSTIDGCNSGAIVGNNMGTVVRSKGNVINAAVGSEMNANGLKLAFGAIGTAKGNTIAAME